MEQQHKRPARRMSAAMFECSFPNRCAIVQNGVCDSGESIQLFSVPPTLPFPSLLLLSAATTRSVLSRRCSTHRLYPRQHTYTLIFHPIIAFTSAQCLNRVSEVAFFPYTKENKKPFLTHTHTHTLYCVERRGHCPRLASQLPAITRRTNRFRAFPFAFGQSQWQKIYAPA